ncbi:MAG TPA: xanthine dehydrogenase family protein subunit M [Verrucomicrobiae bacterium]|nr:xanthine dehydrogenase family protein subunit M [Verrucomicrobiae bacterium]
MRAATTDIAVGYMAGNRNAAFVAGGTTLVDLLKLNAMTAAALVDINDLPLRRIEEVPGGGLRLGALARNSDVANDPRVKQKYPVLSEALLSGASPQLRNMATVGGNLMQRTRCPYFRDGYSACNKREPGSGCAALGGYTRSHAILGASERCIATFPGDMPVALLALDAVVLTRRADGTERTLPLANFYVSYGEDPAKETVLDHGELITAVELPATRWLRHSAYVKVRDRASFDFALASAAVALEVEDGSIKSARVALGGVATKPWRSTLAEEALTGAAPEERVFAAAAEGALKEARAQKHNGFKIALAQRTLARALGAAASKAA